MARTSINRSYARTHLLKLAKNIHRILARFDLRAQRVLGLARFFDMNSASSF